MKDYKRYILWVDYFNSSLSRAEGRRVSVDKSVKDPTLQELSGAATRLGFHPESAVAKFPNRMMIPSGYISIEKKSPNGKTKVITDLAKSLSTVRGEKSSAPASGKDQKAQQQQQPSHKKR